MTKKTNPSRRYAMMAGVAVFAATVTYGAVVTLQGSQEVTQVAMLHEPLAFIGSNVVSDTAAPSEMIAPASRSLSVASAAMDAASSVVSGFADMAGDLVSSAVAAPK